MAPKIVDKLERKNAIADGALDVFARLGFEKASISLIANECGVGKGTVYEYFESKEELFIGAVMQWLSQIEAETLQRIKALPAPPSSPLHQLREYLLACVQAFTGNPYFKRMSVVMTHLMISHETWLVESNFMAKSTQMFRQMIVELIQAAVTTNELPVSALEMASYHAVNLIAGMDGIEMHAAISEGYVKGMHQYEIYIDTYLNGIRNS